MVEDVILDYENLNELSVKDNGSDYVTLLKNNEFVCEIEVFTDVDNSDKEYIVINNTIIYLDTLNN